MIPSISLHGFFGQWTDITPSTLVLLGVKALPLSLYIVVVLQLRTRLRIENPVCNGAFDALVHDDRIDTPSEILRLDGNEVHIQHLVSFEGLEDVQESQGENPSAGSAQRF